MLNRSMFLCLLSREQKKNLILLEEIKWKSYAKTGKGKIDCTLLWIDKRRDMDGSV